MDKLNYNETIYTSDSAIYIANKISARINRKLNKGENKNVIEFIKQHKNSNWNGLTTTDIRNKLADLFVYKYFTNEGRDRMQSYDDIIDIHEILKERIGTNEQEPDYDSFNQVNADGIPISKETRVVRPTIQPTIQNPTTPTAPIIPNTSQEERKIETKVTISDLNMVKNVENIKGILGKNDEIGIQTLLNPQATYRKNYIILDSRYRNTAQDVPGGGITTFSWNFLSNSVANTMGAVNSIGRVEQLVSIKCPNIRLPYKDSILVNAYKRVSLLINEFSGQSYIGQENRRFHFLYSTELDTNFIECKALPLETATFQFAKPITQIDTLTISFGNPLEQVTFDMDRALMSVTYGGQAQFTSNFKHNLQTGDQVYVTGFTTNDPVADFAIIAQTNSTNGYNIYVIDDYTIQIGDLDYSTIVNPINPLTVNVYFGSKRIFIPLELEYINSAQTKTM